MQFLRRCLCRKTLSHFAHFLKQRTDIPRLIRMESALALKR